jgi:predicted ferric reductase
MTNSILDQDGRKLETSCSKSSSPSKTIDSSTASDKCVESEKLNCILFIDTEEPTNAADILFENDKEKMVEVPCEDNANHSHPSLEFAPFFFLIQNHPVLLNWSRLLYRFRWKMSYPLQRNFFGSRYLSKFGIYLTFGEILFMMPLIGATVGGMLYTAFYPSVMKSGRMSRFLVISAFLLAQRNSYVTFIFGLSVDRAIFYHKASGRLAFLVGILHTITYVLDPHQQQFHQNHLLFGAFNEPKCISGSILLILTLLLSMSSLPWIRHLFFEVFYYVHLLCIAGIVVCTLFHSGILVPILILGTWGFDLFIRSVIMARVKNSREAKLFTVSDSVTEICIQKTKQFSYNPGQYMYISIPEISWTQWHPFSIASAPNEDSIKFYVRKAGDWTNSLFELASSKSTIDILVEGPYGSLSVDIMSDNKYRSVMLLSGGIGGKILTTS